MPVFEYGTTLKGFLDQFLEIVCGIFVEWILKR